MQTPALPIPSGASAKVTPSKAQRQPAIKRSYESASLTNHSTLMSREQMNAALERDGYCVVSHVLTPAQCDAATDAVWTYFEKLSPAIKRDDMKTFNSTNRPLHTRGLVQHYNVGFQEASVLVRQWVKPVFAELYGTQKLWTSVDGVSVSIKPKRCHYKNEADWQKNHWEDDAVHVDQTTVSADGKHSCVQGGVAITDQHADEHVFLCVPGSHKFHKELLALGPTKKKLHWEIMKEEHHQVSFLRSKGLEMKRVPLKRGDMVLWDSRVVHSSSPYFATCPAGAQRIQIFACMLPVSRVPFEQRAVQMAKRQKAYDDGVVSKHSPDLIRFFGKLPQTYGKPQGHFVVPASVQMTLEEKRLHGLAPYGAE